MIDTNKQNSTNEYNTAINIIGSLRDVGVISRAIKSFIDEDDNLENFIITRNELNIRTEKSQKRILYAIKESFLEFISEDHYDLFANIFSRDENLPEKDFILFWQFALLNRLFREISVNVFCPNYFSGKVGITKDDIAGYIKELMSKNEDFEGKWSENTIFTLSTKYLKFLTKLNFLEGKQKKTFRYIRTSDETLILFLYFAKLYDPSKSNILKNELLPLSFVNKEDILDRLKRLSIKGFFNMTFNGVDLRIELKHSFKGICDVIYN
jgi:hypothetical protein